MTMAQVESRVRGATPGVRASDRKGDKVNGGLKIGQLAHQVGVTAKAIRFYEAKHVLPRLRHREDSLQKAEALFANVTKRTNELVTKLPSNYELLKSIHRR